jgi:sucrose-6-phosphate hydrolase SacC (GH32 family)
MQRLRFHFEPKKGWINDPNGLVWFNGRYHAFFQHYPHAPKWGQMHWGHTVSDDLVHWEELPIALYPDQPYENGGGCFSGSAIVKDGTLYLFYTSVDKQGRQTQSMAESRDGITFVKNKNNPIIPVSPLGDNQNFRDPKVLETKDGYAMVVGAGIDGIGKLLLYRSHNLYDWQYAGTILEGEAYGPVIECPDLFPLGGRYVLMFSRMHRPLYATQFVIGDFDGTRFIPDAFHEIEAGPDFYAPQTFLNSQGRRIMIAWMSNWEKPVPEGAERAGAFTIPRELTLAEGLLRNVPVAEARSLLQADDPHVLVFGNALTLRNASGETVLEKEFDAIRDIHILRDSRSIEVFVNNGEWSATYWYQ